ncbi:nucleoside phosphorylase [Candidatus Termititenax dinenymphae]|uniref:Nucleoside phosphorylase n=1 Tax=Candidatus Termititenax dinenymphae TaxID=2218523 RepID=A0A388TK11_9BACT|nr:nucleoside phosphorylase [Candidatus Termititenax dinenymphae]
MRSSSLGVIIAVKDEAAAVLADAAYQWQKLSAQIYFSKPRNIYLNVCGIGKANAAFALGQIFDKAAEFIMFGTSGGLGQEKIGSLYLCSEFVEHDMSATTLGVEPGVTPFSGMSSAVIACPLQDTLDQITKICQTENLELHTGRTLSGDQFIHSKELADSKSALFGGQLCDMESAAVAKVCQHYQKPFCAVRYITDNADHNAPASWQENVKTSADYFNRILLKL